MQWSEVTKPPSKKMLRQFAGLCLVVFTGLAAWRWFHGQHHDGWTMALGGAGLVLGGAGLLAPSFLRPVYTGWMIAAFPIGWTVSRLALGTIFFVVVTPLAMLFRLQGRDTLRRRRVSRASFWTPKRQAAGAETYFRQS